MIDSHCHLNFPDFNNDRDAVIKRAEDAGVVGFLTVATGPENWQQTLDLAEGRPKVRVALGLHPQEAEQFTPELGAQLRKLAGGDARVVAIGETGLDFFRNRAPREKQFEAFHAQLDIAAGLKKPFILHCRAAEEEMLEVLAKRNSLRGVWHCFTGSAAMAERAAVLGLYFGIGGIATYPKAGELREAVAAMPSDKILLETDCPYLPPQPWRGQRNEPAYLVRVAEVIAEARKTTAEEIRRIATENARRLFDAWK